MLFRSVTRAQVNHVHIITATSSFRLIDKLGKHAREHFATPAAIFSEWLDYCVLVNSSSGIKPTNSGI